MQSSSFIGAIDQGTTSSRFIVFDRDTFSAVHVQRSPVELKPVFAHPGWAEMCPRQIFDSVVQAMAISFKAMPFSKLKAIGIVNQRETVVAWDKETVWYDTRTSQLVEAFKSKAGSCDFLAKRCGLPFSTYFSALKIKWLMENEPYRSKLNNALDRASLRIGTVDTWLLDRLTGGKSYFTDVTNASRTGLMNIKTLEWDRSLFDFFGLSELFDSFPTIKPNCFKDYGVLETDKVSSSFPGAFKIPITAMMGDQHASLLGHGCVAKGDTKATFGTGCFLLTNTGEDIVEAPGLITTVAFKLGDDLPASYALEGSIAMAGQLLRWLKDNFAVPPGDIRTIDDFLEGVRSSSGVFFISSLTGMFSPIWRSDLKASIHGLTLDAQPEHICRAALDSIAFQLKMITDLVATHSPIARLSIDGGLSGSAHLCQVVSETLEMDVVRPFERELSSLGGAMAALVGLEPCGRERVLDFKMGRNSLSVCKGTNQAQLESYKVWRQVLERELRANTS